MQLHKVLEVEEGQQAESALPFVFQEAAVKNAPLFLQYLTEQMHERVPGSLILWYDSVIENGQLKWQNELNQSNK